jgi:hypothetical protein
VRCSGHKSLRKPKASATPLAKRFGRLDLVPTKPLDLGGYVPYLHANFFVTHAFNRDAEARANRFTGVLGLALPILASTAVVFDLVHGQQEEKGRVENLAEIGIPSSFRATWKS